MLVPEEAPMPTTLNVSLPDELKAFVVREVARGGYGSASEYVREVLRGAVARRSREDLERKLLEGLASPSSEMKSADWRSLRAGVRRRRKA
jgi:antitoxin ParD1/3/4